MTQPPPPPPPPALPSPPALPPLPPPRKTSRTALIVGGVIAGVVLLCCGGTVITAINGDDTDDDAGTGTQATASADSSASSASPSPSSSTSGAGETAPGIGVPVTDGQLQFTVTGQTCGATEFDGVASANGHYCQVAITAKNVGKEAALVGTAGQRGLIGKQAYESDSVATIEANNDSELWLSEIDPGRQFSGVIVFDVPKGATLTAVELHETTWSPGVTVSLTTAVAESAKAAPEPAPVQSRPSTKAPTKAAPGPTAAAPAPVPAPTEPASAYYANCAAAKAAGAAPLHRGDPGYRSGLDRDNDGVACES